MSAKQKILSTLRLNPVSRVDLPKIDVDADNLDLRQAFRESLELVGGSSMEVDSRDVLNEALQSISPFADASTVCSQVPGIAKANVDLSEVEDPHDLVNVDFFVAPGHFGVAENGAVWVTDEDMRHRVALFICQHLALIIDGTQLVANMHEAYGRLNFLGKGFGAFISGPSKTADIEQSLVIGAHGARSLTVVLVG